MSEPKDPTSFNEPSRPTLNDFDVEGLGQAVLTLTKEIWVLTDRLHVMEAVLAKKGIDISEDIERFQPDKDLAETLKTDGEALINRVLTALSGQ